MTTDFRRVIAVLAAALALVACAPDPQDRSAAAADARVPGPSTAAAPGHAAAWSLPVQAGMQPDLAVAPDGSLLLSWVEPSAGTHSLRVARWHGDWWAPAHTVATADSFGNAFDTPQVEQTQDGALWITWLRGSPAGADARDVVIARSTDGGANWSRAVAVNTDATATEHGFVSLWRASRDSIGVAWLDGRAKQGGAGHSHMSDDAMQMLRAAVFDARLARHGETAIDLTVCDCCHTAVALASHGPVLVYRDRTAGEVRDIHAAVLRGGTWRDTGAVHADGWVMPGCPVNGPSVAADGNRVTAAWYTAADGVPSLHYAVSEDGGLHFGDGMPLARGDGVLGRVAVASDAGGTWFGWIAESNGAQVLQVARLERASRETPTPVTLAKLATHGNGAGMPRLAIAGGRAYAVWTDMVDGEPRLVGKRL